MLGVRRRRRDLRVELGGGQAFVGDRRIIVEMDQIVRDTGMLRLALPDRLQDCRALELLRVGLVIGRRRRIERDRIENLRFVVVRIF